MIFHRYWRFAALLFLSAGYLCAQAEFREFTDTQGRTIRAKIFSSDGLMVKLELEDGSGYETPINVFTANDQAYIKSWRPEMSASQNDERVEISQVEVVDGYYHRIGDDLGISGVVYENFVDDTPKAEINLMYGLQHGKYTQWHESTGNKEFEANFYQGKRDGITTFWYPSGKLKSQTSYKAGTQHGLANFWYESGQMKSESIWHAGQKFGIRTDWYPNGQKKSEVNYANNKLDGPGTHWYQNGEQHISASWKNGIQTGSYMEWHPNGQKKKEAVYDDQGILLSDIKEWDEEGKEIKKSRKERSSGKEKKSGGGFFSVFKKDKTKTKESKVEEPRETKPGKPRGPLLPPQGDEGYYVKLLGMISVPTEAVWSSNSTLGINDHIHSQTHDLELDSSFTFGAAWGRDLGSYRIELEGIYSGYSINTVNFDTKRATYPYSAVGDIEFFSLHLNNFYELEFTPRFETYAGIGLGLTMKSIEGASFIDNTSKIRTILPENKSGFSWQILTGMKYTIFDRHSIVGGYRFLSYGDFTDIEDLGSHNFELGYRLNL